MKKLYINYAMIGLSIIFSSLSGMEKPHYTLTVQPIGGLLTSSNTIHFALIKCTKNNEIDQKACQFFKYNKPVSTLLLKHFTEGESYTITKDEYTVTFIS